MNTTNYYKLVIFNILESKMPKERKCKILANLRNMMVDYYVHRRTLLIIDEKGFEYFLQKIKEEEELAIV